MPDASYRLYFGSAPATREQMAMVDSVQVDCAMGLAAEAELRLPVGIDDQGYWSVFEEAFAAPLARIRVEARIGSGDYVPLIDGPVVGQKFELSAGPGSSQAVLTVQDDGALLNREEKVEVYEEQEDADVAQALIAEAGLEADLDGIPASGAALGRVVVRRGTAMQLLRELATRHGLFAYVAPGDAPGASVVRLKRPDLSPSGYPDLLLTGPDRNLSAFQARFDALKPFTAQAGGVQVADVSALTSLKSASSQSPLGATAVLDLLQPPAAMLLARTREEQADLDEAAQARVDLSTWAYSATAEVVAGTYNTVLEPYRTIRVRGVGGHLSGDWLISRVVHVLDARSYAQKLTLRRNARSAGAGGASGLPGGVF
ncbi:MAG TPA: hypothetical protein VJ385_22090 [Fibrobacteria bacterium]|nr:hypothetical protein [Fibrobacteria bacterium]